MVVKHFSDFQSNGGEEVVTVDGVTVPVDQLEDYYLWRDGRGEPEGVIYEDDEYDLHEVDFSPAVLQTHMSIRNAIEARVRQHDQIRFYSDYTGRGKTSGAILTLGEMVTNGDCKRVLFLTREIAGVEEVYRTFSGTWPNLDVVPWSGAHRGSHTSRLDLKRTDVTRDEARQAQVVIATHAAGKVWRKNGDYPLGQNFDAVLIDEYPDPVAGGQFHLSEAEALSEQYYYGPMGEQAEALRNWMRELQDFNSGKAGGIKRLPKPDWAKEIDPRFPKEVKALADAVQQGRSFVVTRGKHRSLHWSRLDMPFEDRALLCSATNDVEGWALDPRFSAGKLSEFRGIPTSYEDVQVTFKPWPKEPAKTRNPELGDRHTVEALQDAILHEVAYNLPKDDEETLVLMPKTLKDNLSDAFIRQVQKARGDSNKVYLHSWGSGIGTNLYKDCKYAVVVGLFHQNAFGIRQKINGHKLHQSEEIRSYGVNSKEVTTTRDNEHARQIIQMLNRIRIRNMQDNPANPFIAEAAEIIWIATPEDTDRACKVLEREFQGINVDRSEVVDEIEVIDDPRQVRGWDAKARVICRQMEKAGRLSFTSKDVDAEWGGYPKHGKERQRFRAAAEDLGWKVQVFRGRGKATTFTR
jgi:hypothetical protein